MEKMEVASITGAVFMAYLKYSVKSSGPRQIVRECWTYLYSRGLELFMFDGAELA
jgi:hypothetical protein